MIKEFEKLTDEERALLYRAPALVSVLEACTNHAVNQTKKNDAIKLAHLKTFTADPLLLPYYAEVEKSFREEFERLVKTYAPFSEAQKNRIHKEIERVKQVLAKLDPVYAQTLEKSLVRFADHVRRSTHSVFQDFIFAFPIAGLNE